MSENSKKHPSQFAKASGDIFQGLILSDNQVKIQKYSYYYKNEVKEKQQILTTGPFYLKSESIIK